MMRDQATFELSTEAAAPRAPSRVTQPRFWQTLPARWNSDADDTLVCCQVR